MGSRVYVGNLPTDAQDRELEDIFEKYGKLRSLDMKGGRDGAPKFAFAEYDDPRDASECVRGENGREFAGNRMRVELARGERDRFRDGGGGGYGDRGGYGGGGGGYGRDRYDDRGGYGGGGGGGGYGRDRYDDYGGGGGGGGGYSGGRAGLGPSPYGPSRKTEFEVIVSGLEPNMSWQDLKDHFRTFRIEVTHADVDRRGNGNAMFASREDLDVALKEVDGSEMRNMRGTCTLRVDPADGGGGGGGGGGRDRERDRSPPRRSRSPPKDYDRDHRD